MNRRFTFLRVSSLPLRSASQCGEQLSTVTFPNRLGGNSLHGKKRHPLNKFPLARCAPLFQFLIFPFDFTTQHKYFSFRVHSESDSRAESLRVLARGESQHHSLDRSMKLKSTSTRPMGGKRRMRRPESEEKKLIGSHCRLRQGLGKNSAEAFAYHPLLSHYLLIDISQWTGTEAFGAIFFVFLSFRCFREKFSP
jgi:hypothetical protein